MIKFLLSISIIYLLGSCALNKISPSEKCLLPNSSQNKIYIMSCFPETSNKSGIYLSTLLVSTSVSNKQPVSAFIHTFDRADKSTSSHLFYNNSIENFNLKRFPILVQSAQNDTTAANFSFSLNRKKSIFKSEALNFQIGYKTQKKFTIDTIGTEYKIHRIVPKESTINLLNQKTVNQPSNYLIHTIDHAEGIFSSSKLYWLDFQLNESIHTIFLKENSNGDSEILYSTLALENDANIQLVKSNNETEITAEKTLLRIDNTENQPIYFITQTNSPSNKKMGNYAVSPVDVIQNNVVIGNGIIYILEGKKNE